MHWAEGILWSEWTEDVADSCISSSGQRTLRQCEGVDMPRQAVKSPNPYITAVRREHRRRKTALRRGNHRLSDRGSLNFSMT